VVIGLDGVSLAVSDQTTWHFTTRIAGPADPSAINVGLEGAGDFCSVQGALDAVPANNTAPVTITIAPGTYREIVHFRAKNNVTLHGMDRKATIIAATNNNNLNGGTAIRSLVGVDASSGVAVENLTIHNLTPQNGSQAEALRMQTCDKCIVRDADILSLQDTLLFSGRVYVDNSFIAGNVDFVWGTGIAYFNNCEIKTVGRTGYNVQARNGASVTAYGYVFVDSRLTSDPGITGNYLARVDAGVYPGSHVAYINCQLGSHISPVGWLLTAGTATAALRFWEYGSVDPAGNPIDVSQRLAGSTQLTADQAAMMRDPTMVLGGWDPTATSPSP
jgi:pectin methylesterase-like acyl-CoA thioesterase